MLPYGLHIDLLFIDVKLYCKHKHYLNQVVQWGNEGPSESNEQIDIHNILQR